MICLGSTDGVNEDRPELEQLFAALQRAGSSSERQELVCNALSSGISQDEIREMLDYLETCGSSDCCGRQVPAPKSSMVAARHKGSWATFFSGLIYRYR